MQAKSCLETEQKLLEEVSACESIDELRCLRLKAEFNLCNNSCKKELEKAECFEICKPVCNE